MASTCRCRKPNSKSGSKPGSRRLPRRPAGGSASVGKFLHSSGGMAATLLAMNEVFGRFFNVSLIEMFEPAAYAAAAPPRDLFVFDDQLHFVRGSKPSPAGLRAIAQGPSSAPTVKSNPFNPQGQLDERGEKWGVWDPKLVGLPIDAGYAHITRFIKDVYLD